MRLPTMQTKFAWIGLSVAFLVVGCFGRGQEESVRETSRDTKTRGAPSSMAHSAGDRVRTDDFLATRREDYRRAIERAESWLVDLDVRPWTLREQGLKGKKKLTALLDVYVRLMKVAGPEKKAEYREEIDKLADITRQSRYHNMEEVSLEHFKEDSTSYLRAAYLLDQAGVDISYFRPEIEQINDELDAHMQLRGSHQQMVFDWYYEYFGLEKPYDMSRGFEDGVIASRYEPWQYDNRLNVYHLTHEIYVPYRFGDRLETDFFDADDRKYLERVVPWVLIHSLVEDDPDLVGELVSCMVFLDMTEHRAFRTAIDYLFQAQNDDGSWGEYSRYREHYGEYVDEGYYLHTTMVALGALTAAFDMR